MCCWPSRGPNSNLGHRARNWWNRSCSDPSSRSKSGRVTLDARNGKELLRLLVRHAHQAHERCALHPPSATGVHGLKPPLGASKAVRELCRCSSLISPRLRILRSPFDRWSPPQRTSSSWAPNKFASLGAGSDTRKSGPQREAHQSLRACAGFVSPELWIAFRITTSPSHRGSTGQLKLARLMMFLSLQPHFTVPLVPPKLDCRSRCWTKSNDSITQGREQSADCYLIHQGPLPSCAAEISSSPHVSHGRMEFEEPASVRVDVFACTVVRVIRVTCPSTLSGTLELVSGMDPKLEGDDHKQQHGQRPRKAPKVRFAFRLRTSTSARTGSPR